MLDATATPGPIPRRYVSWAEAERYTGLSQETLRRMARRSQIRVYRPTPRRALLDLAELDAAVRGGPVSA